MAHVLIVERLLLVRGRNADDLHRSSGELEADGLTRAPEEDRLEPLAEVVEPLESQELSVLVASLVAVEEAERRTELVGIDERDDGVQVVEAVLERRAREHEGEPGRKTFDDAARLRLPVLDPLPFVEDDEVPARLLDMEDVFETPMVQVAMELTSSEWKGLSAARRDADRDPTKVARLEARLRARRLELVERSLRQAVAGQDARLLTVEIGSGGPIAGVHIAPHYRASGYLAATPKLHLRVTFDRPVAGPIAVGRGRHVGFGVLWPAD